MVPVLDRRLILIAGKGGVGRSAMAAAIASACARRGRRTLLYQASAADRFADFFASAPIGPEIREISNNLCAINTTPETALEEYGLMILKFRRVYRMVFENRISKYFLRAIPGLDDYAVLGKAWHHSTEKTGNKWRFDTIVFDLPASGHSLSMLKIPWVITDTVPDGPLTKTAHQIKELLCDRDRTAVVLTTLAEEMPANEAEELSASLRTDLNLETSHLLINQLYPDRFPAGSPSEKIVRRLSGASGLDSVMRSITDHSELMLGRRRLNERYLAELANKIDAPRTEVPMLFTRQLGPAEIQHLSTIVEPALST